VGGGGFMVIRLANGTSTTIDYRERAPLKSTETMYLGADGKIDRKLTAEGYLAPGVPGTVRGLAMAHERYGSLPWKTLVMPAADLAQKGHELTESEADMLNWLIKNSQQFPSTIAEYGRQDGKPWKKGERAVFKDLAKTLKAIAEKGPDAFYTGWIADRIAADMAEHGGIISKEDLAQYKAVERLPVRGTFLGHEIISMPPPSSGGIALIEMLNFLERFDIGSRPRLAATTLHLEIEAMRRAFLDRAEFLGDPDFVSVPVERLTAKGHAAIIAETLDTTRATSSTALAHGRFPVAGHESDQTTHFSVVDSSGNAVANTYTLEQAFGSRVVIAGTGIILNNEMGDFNKKPGETNEDGDIGTEPNRIRPGKRMLSSMTPTIVTKDGKLLLVTGSPGGRTIINTVLDIVLGVTAFHLSAREAVDAPRLHHQWLPDITFLEAGAVPVDVVETLRQMGHTVKFGGPQGDGHSIVIDPATGIAYGANDRRSKDSKASP
ncbi:MAG: gamma-glutamyltransferase, partial [Gemmatimonadota bacterium]